MVTDSGRAIRSKLPKKARLAADRAQELDRVWFIEHPEHDRYCRWALPREWDNDPCTGEPIQLNASPTHWTAVDRARIRVLVLVTQVYEGARLRLPLFGFRPPVTEHDVPEALWPALHQITTAETMTQGLDDFWRWLAFWGDRLGAEAESWLLEAEAMGFAVRRIARTRNQPILPS
ncbi:hypothetical protein [Saccharothrix obliqua]|uniref:hypothetical protein n=1 Tax=Saccharothrix obliqua TaxID=2861747 RepID=UPI001C5F137B|nr:hypothetical protein [Saccharothrix obliqua]MBW4719801.1 hypothetical protein [Saccharothrix obliqua]